MKARKMLDSARVEIDSTVSAIAEFKKLAKRPISEQDLWEFLIAGVGIRKFFKGHLMNFHGRESSQQVFDRKLKECFGLSFRDPEPTPADLRRLGGGLPRR